MEGTHRRGRVKGKRGQAWKNKPWLITYTLLGDVRKKNLDSWGEGEFLDE